VKPSEPGDANGVALPLRARIGDVARRIFAISWLAVGGPEAHLSVLEAELIERRKWTSQARFLELFSLASMLPGPTSTQVVIGLGTVRAGALGGIVALLVWLTPATIFMTCTALALGWWMSRGGSLDALRGLYPAAVGLIAVAGWRLGRKAVVDARTGALMGLGAVVAVAGQIASVRALIEPINPAYRFPLVILVAGVIASALARGQPSPGMTDQHAPVVRRRTGLACLALFLGLFFALPVVASLVAHGDSEFARTTLAADALYRSGAVVIGGGQVVLPMLHDEFVQRSGWVGDEAFWSAFGIVQAVPGPLFSFSAFLGGATVGRGDVLWTIVGALVGVAALFGPGALIWFGVDPFWSRLRSWPAVRRGLPGAQAAAVGLIAGAFWIMAFRVLHDWLDFALLAFAVGTVLILRLSPILMLLLSAVIGAGVWAIGL
jgi:chromate transporter